MKNLLGVIFGAVILSALLTPPLYQLLLNSFPTFPWPYSRVFDRVLLVVLVALIFVRRRYFNLGAVWGAYRDSSPVSERIKLGALGLALSLISVALCVGLSVYMGSLVYQPEEDLFAPAKILKVLLGAAIVAILEEGLFRVWMFLSIKESSKSLGFALILTNLIYAVVHFITPDKSFTLQGGSPMEGLRYLGVVMSRLSLPGVGLGTVALFVVGLILSAAYLRGRSLYIALGLHAGWIIALKFTSGLTDRAIGLPTIEGLGSRYQLFGDASAWWSFAIVIAALLCVITLRKQKEF